MKGNVMKNMLIGFQVAFGAYMGWQVGKGIDQAFGEVFGPYLQTLREKRLAKMEAQ